MEAYSTTAQYLLVAELEADGIVILRYPSAYTLTFQTGGSLVSSVDSTATVSGYVRNSNNYNTSGTGTITFALTP